MGRMRGQRAWLAAGNPLLLLAAMPAVGRSDEAVPRTAGRGADAQRSDRSDLQHKPKPDPPKQIRPRESNTHQAPSRTRDEPSASRGGDDDDDAGDAAGKVAGACCAGFIGAVAEGAAKDPTDVEDYDPEPLPPAPPARDPEPAQAEASQAPTHSSRRFDNSAAKVAILNASREIREQCETEQEQLGNHTVKVAFEPTGRAVLAEITPPPKSDRVAKCARASYLRAKVPPFDGDTAIVTKSFKAPAPAPADGGTEDPSPVP